MSCVYKLTRSDGLEYIGITNNLPKRLSSHKRSRRFSEFGITNVEILFDGSYSECEEREEQFIEMFNTFKRGLNMTNKGKGRSDTTKFSTFGCKFSDSSKLKMSDAAKRRIDRPVGYKHSDNTKLKWSRLREGKVWGLVKIDKNILLSEWNNYIPPLEELEALKSPTNPTKFRNGRTFSHDRGKLAIFIRLKSVDYGVSANAIKRVILNEYTI